ncbi:MAG: enoyl-CoA hydratase-related protein [Sphingomonadales bacterium]|nr:enoyl-CoA hydratase-related protein [Sphingomonadales bacterium]
MATGEEPLVLVTPKAGATWVTLNQASRHNCLNPPLIGALGNVLQEALASEPVAVVLAARGPSFSTGGDLKGFLAHADDPAELRDYSFGLVDGLHRAVKDLVACPVPVIARINGPITGGSIGLMLAADLVVMAETAFVRPYYVELGFAPDGGWTALLPERIGPAAAARIQLLNQRIDAPEALRLGLVDEVVAESELDSVVCGWVAALARKERESLRTTKRLIWDAARRERIATRLDAERDAFVALIGRAEVRERLTRTAGDLKVLDSDQGAQRPGG